MASNDVMSDSDGTGSESLENSGSGSSHNKLKSEQSQTIPVTGSIPVGDVPSDIEMAGQGKGGAGQTRWQRAWNKRWFTNGVRAVPFGIFTFCLTTLCICAIAIPTLLLGMGPPLAQDAVSATYIYIYNNRVSNWAYRTANDSDCAPFYPSSMTITQDIYFTGIPWYATLGPLYIRPANFTLSYNGTDFGYLFVPQIDLNNVDGGNKWANDTVTTLTVSNITAFLQANQDIIPLAGLSRGWTIWHQIGEVILDETVIGVQMYYSATMSQDINVTEVTFLDGPIQPDLLSQNVMNALACTAEYITPA